MYEEAVARMILHGADTARKRLCIEGLRVVFGTGKNLRYIPLNKITTGS